MAIQWRGDAPFWLDVAEFENHLRQAERAPHADDQVQHLEQAATIYGGDLLPGCYSDWLLAERAIAWRRRTARRWRSWWPCTKAGATLSAVSAQLVIALERAYSYEVAEARRIQLEHELQVAREVQAELMAREMPDLRGYNLANAWRPAREVAGDFYDVFPLGKDRWGIVRRLRCIPGATTLPWATASPKAWAIRWTASRRSAP